MTERVFPAEAVELVKEMLEVGTGVPVYTGTPQPVSVPMEAVRAAFIALYERPHIEGVSISDMRRSLQAAAPLMRSIVTTEDDLDALPLGSVVLSVETAHHEGGWPIAYQRWQDGNWHRGGRSGSTHPDNFLPATILHVAVPHGND